MEESLCGIPAIFFTGDFFQNLVLPTKLFEEL
jgi:hypothetical protein